MAFKHPNTPLSAFSMASMTDVIFLLLVFFMVTSTFVFPTAMDINLPEGSEQASIKPSTRVFIDSLGNISASYADADRQSFDTDELLEYLQMSLSQDTTQTSVAIYADEAARYGRIVEVLNIGASNGIKMVLATKPGPPKSATPVVETIEAKEATTQETNTDNPGQ